MSTSLLLALLAIPPAAGDDPAASGAQALLWAARALDGPFRDAVVVETTTRGAPARVEYTVTYGARGEDGEAALGLLERGPVTAFLEDDWANVTHAARPEAYFVAEAAGDGLEDLLRLFDPGLALLPHPALRAAEDGYDAVGAFATSWEDEVEVTGHRTEERDGREVEVVTLSHAGGSETIVLDAATHRIVRRQAERGGVAWTAAHDVRPLDEDAEVAPFDPGERALEGELLALLRAAAGDEAAPFVAPGLDGEPVSLAALHEDTVVVLDFWATWCRPCLRGLKELDRFAAEADPEQVKVVAVNVSERLPDDERREVVGEFWRKAGYGFPTLLDFDDAIRRSYGAAEIPLTVVIGRDGTIRAVHPEDEPLLEWLREETAAARR